MPPKILTLAFDTSAAHCAAALLWGDAILGEFYAPMAKGQAEQLFPVLEDILKQAGKSWTDLDRIGVGTGPGNFTGTRISVSAARGLALSLEIPAIGISTFQAMALDLEQPVLAILDARADQYYYQWFGWETHDEPGLLGNSVNPPKPEKGLTAIVGGAGAELAARAGADMVEPKHSLAVAIGRIAQMADATIAGRPTPLYLRQADAAPPREQPPIILA